MLLFTASDLASLTSHIHSWVLFCFRSIPKFFQELFLHWSPVAYWAPTNPGSSSFSILSFCLFILFVGFSRQQYTLLQWATLCQTSPPWPACPGWPHPAWLSFIELDKAVVHMIRLASFSVIMVSVCLPSDTLSQHYRLTLVSLTLDVGYLFTAAPAKHSCCFLSYTRSPFLTLNVE